MRMDQRIVQPGLGVEAEQQLDPVMAGEDLLGCTCVAFDRALFPAIADGIEDLLIGLLPAGAAQKFPDVRRDAVIPGVKAICRGNLPCDRFIDIAAFVVGIKDPRANGIEPFELPAIGIAALITGMGEVLSQRPKPAVAICAGQKARHAVDVIGSRN